MTNKLDKHVMLSRLARLRGSALRRLALGRAIVIMLLAMTHSFAAASETNTPNITTDEKPFNVYNTMNVKLYLHNQISDWDQFECANELAFRESSWRSNAVNKTTGAYGLFQHMSDHAHKWDAFEQIHKHIEYIDTRYSGSWCNALQHLSNKGWH
jgi:hypothetical protein